MCTPSLTHTHTHTPPIPGANYVALGAGFESNCSASAACMLIIAMNIYSLFYTPLPKVNFQKAFLVVTLFLIFCGEKVLLYYSTNCIRALKSFNLLSARVTGITNHRWLSVLFLKLHTHVNILIFLPPLALVLGVFSILA